MKAYFLHKTINLFHSRSHPYYRYLAVGNAIGRSRGKGIERLPGSGVGSGGKYIADLW